MKSKIILSLSMVIFLIGYSCKQADQPVGNILLSTFDTPFGVPPFESIQSSDFLPALDSAINLHNREIQAIINQEEPANFENTISALDQSGALMRQVNYIYRGLKSAHGTDGIQTIAAQMGAKMAAHKDDIGMNPDLFARVEQVYNNQDELNLNTAQKTLLDKFYKQFVRAGVNLPAEKQERVRAINVRLTELSTQFDQNLLAETNDFKLVVDNEANLSGLSEAQIATAAATATKYDLDGKWVFTTHKPSMIPFLQSAENRDLREQLYHAYFTRGNNNNEFDNKEIIAEMANLRIEKAQLLGYETFAHYVLEERMSKTPENVDDLLLKLWEPSVELGKKERAEMQAIIDAEGGDFKLQSWDWWYYAEKLRKQKYDLDENELRPYFSLEQVSSGIFYVVNQLWGLQIEKIEGEFPKMHHDADVFEVKDADGSHLGILYMDYHPRETKNQGAWCGVYRKQVYADGKKVAPVVTIVTNFSTPVGDQPALLSLDETTTLFHEFGHGLHQLFSDVKYQSISGTSVPRDFVELPSQIMENWAMEPDVLKQYAKHYNTGEVIPDELIAKIQNSSYFNQGFQMLEYLAASLLDMKYHTLSEQTELDVVSFEDDYLAEMGLIPEVISRYRSTYFKHIWSSGYSAGYYSYIWSEWLDADAFEAFKETTLFDAETAKAFREYILSKGGSDDPMNLYKQFRGKEPAIEPLMKKRGLL